MYRVVRTKQFERSFRKLKESGTFKGVAKKKLETAIELLARSKALPSAFADHRLQGIWNAYRECHIKGDLLLIYQMHDDILVLVLVDIGSHPYLFG